MDRKALVINEEDNVANLIGPAAQGDVAECSVEGQAKTESVDILNDVPSNHKIARRDIAAGEAIIKYGLNIGQASLAIRQGEHVHVHNIESNRGRGDLKST